MKHLERPNIVFLVIDSLRADHVCSYGYDKKTTTFMDNAANDAVLFENAISPSGWTLPVFLSMLTGTYPSKHGMGRYLNVIPTIMELVREHGYQSFGISDAPYLNVVSGRFDKFSYVGTKGEWLKEISRDRKVAFKLGASLLQHGSYLNLATYVRESLKNIVAANWIDKYGRESPFFMLVHYSVHAPYEPPNPFFNAFLDEHLRGRVQDTRRDYYALIAEQDCLVERMKVLSCLYDGLIAWVDSCVGSFVDHLKRSGDYDNTILVITADHGQLLGEHGLYAHAFGLYEPLVRVPLIIRFPDSRYKGKRFSGLVQTLDLFPMLVEYLDLDRNLALREVQGKSILSLLDRRDERAFAVSERADFDPQSEDGNRKVSYLESTYPSYAWRRLAHNLVALRTLDYKYIWSSEGRDELYDLGQDPTESSNVISTQAQKASDLRSVLETWKRTFVAAEHARVELELDGSTKERLRRLGYL